MKTNEKFEKISNDEFEIELTLVALVVTISRLTGNLYNLLNIFTFC